MQHLHEGLVKISLQFVQGGHENVIMLLVMITFGTFLPVG